MSFDFAVGQEPDGTAFPHSQSAIYAMDAAGNELQKPVGSSWPFTTSSTGTTRNITAGWDIAGTSPDSIKGSNTIDAATGFKFVKVYVGKAGNITSIRNITVKLSTDGGSTYLAPGEMIDVDTPALWGVTINAEDITVQATPGAEDVAIWMYFYRADSDINRVEITETDDSATIGAQMTAFSQTEEPLNCVVGETRVKLATGSDACIKDLCGTVNVLAVDAGGMTSSVACSVICSYNLGETQLVKIPTRVPDTPHLLCTPDHSVVLSHSLMQFLRKPQLEWGCDICKRGKFGDCGTRCGILRVEDALSVVSADLWCDRLVRSNIRLYHLVPKDPADFTKCCTMNGMLSEFCRTPVETLRAEGWSFSVL